MLPDKPLQTFISYSRVNQQFAIRLACGLKSAGFCVWMDQFNIPTGARWDDEIEKALRESQIFLFIMTSASIVSDNAKDEVGYAIDHGMRILPVLLEECEIPLRLRRLQYVDFTEKSFDEGIKSAQELLSRLVDEAKQTAGSPGNVYAGREPKTAPTQHKSTLEQIQSRSSRQGKTISKYVAAGIGTGVIGVLVVMALILRPLWFSPPPVIPPSPTNTVTRLPSPTNTVEPTTIPVTSTAVSLRSFTEDFNSNTNWAKDWKLVLRNGDPRKKDSFMHTIADGALTFDISYQFVWGYFLYNPSITYTNVEMDVVVADLRSTDTFALICQYSDQGWYEFDINGGGTYTIRYVDGMDSAIDEEQYIIGYGFIPGYKDSIATTRENTIRASCDRNILNLAVNDKELINDVQGKFAPEEGQVGIAVRTYENYPIHVVVKSIIITEP